MKTNLYIERVHKTCLVIIVLVIVIGCKSFDVAYNVPYILSYQTDNYNPNNPKSSWFVNTKKSELNVILTFLKNDSLEAKSFAPGSKLDNYTVERHPYKIIKQGIAIGDVEYSSDTINDYHVNKDSLSLTFFGENPVRYTYLPFRTYKQKTIKDKIEKMLEGNNFKIDSLTNSRQQLFYFKPNNEVTITNHTGNEIYKKNCYWTLDTYNEELLLIVSAKEPFESNTRSFTYLFHIKGIENGRILYTTYRWMIRENAFKLVKP